MRKKINPKKIIKHPYTPLILFPIILFSKFIFGGKALFWGTPLTQFIPWWKWAFDTLRSGYIPLWNPLVGMGAPLIGNYQSALFYPPNWILLLLYWFGGISALAWGQGLVVCLHLIWSSIGMSVLTRRLGLGKLSQIISGLSFGLSGYLVSRAWFSSINASLAWLPWVLIASFDLVVTKEKWPKVIKLGVLAGLQLLAGHAQTTWYTWLLGGLWIGFWGWSYQEPVIDRTRIKVLALLKTWIRYGISILIGLCLAAVQLFPTFVYLLQSQRASAVDYKAAMTYSFWPWRILGLIAPNLYGNPAHGNYWGYGNFWEDAIYIGLLPFILSVVVLISHLLPGKKLVVSGKGENETSIVPRKSLFVFLLGIILASILFALGQNTPVFPWFYHHIPSFDMFQSPTRFSIWLVFALGLLSGFGVQAWKRPTGRALYWTRLATVGAFGISLSAGIGEYYINKFTTVLKPTFVPAIAFLGLWCFGAGLLSLTIPKDEKNHTRKSLWSGFVVFWVAIDLLFAGWGLNPGIDLDYYQVESDDWDRIQQMLADGRLFLPLDDEYSLKYDQYFNFDSFSPKRSWNNLWESVLPNMNLLGGIPVVNNYDPLVPARYAQWMGGLSNLNPSHRDQLLALMNVTVLEKLSKISDYGVEFSSVTGSKRVRWVNCARYVDNSEEAWQLITTDRVNFDHMVILEESKESKIQGCNPLGGQADIIREDPNSILLHTYSEEPGWVVISDTWYPGWKVWLDGDSVPLIHANYLFRAVEVPEGPHSIRFSYRPPWFYLGLTLSLLGSICVIGYLLKTHFKSQRGAVSLH